MMDENDRRNAHVANLAREAERIARTMGGSYRLSDSWGQRSLPKSEKELRLQAVEVLDNFLKELDEEQVFDDRIPIYSLFDIKCAVVWAARAAIRQFCPELAESADLNLSSEFAPEEDKPL